MLKLPVVIQGGMGVYISTPFLARAVSTYGSGHIGLGTVSGVSAPHILAAILRKGDPGGHYRRALANFPFQDVAHRILRDYYVEGGAIPKRRHKRVTMYTLRPPRELIELTVAANFALVWIAKEGHPYPVSINYLEKVQLPALHSVFGAMLAGVDVVTVGAGIPLQFPALFDAYTTGVPAQYRVAVEGALGNEGVMEFDPTSFFEQPLPKLTRPAFLPIISSDSLAGILVSKLPKQVDGFVVELPTAGGHNAGPRGNPKTFNDRGEPVYGDKDKVNFEKLRKLGLPFSIGGALASPQGISWAQEQGACGIQAGSIFALCNESGMSPRLAAKVRLRGFRGELDVLTSNASPTGFPFKVVNGLRGTLSDPEVYARRHRVCNKGYLDSLHRLQDGAVVQRCPSEPVVAFMRKGGSLEETVGKSCLCNGLLAAAELGDAREPAIVTLGDDVSFLRHLMADEQSTYSAADALGYLTQGQKQSS